MKAKEKKKGISLIVLVITIIVIIVLAVAVILTVAKNNPIENAKEAVKANDKMTAQEVANMAYADWYTKKELGETVTENARDYVGNELTAQGFSESQKNIALNKVLNTPVVPNGFTASDIETEDEITEGFVIYAGDEKVSTDVDAKTTRNQFVWVPVEDISEFVREEGYSNGRPQSMLANCSEPFTSAVAEEIAEYNNMKKSVEKYGGFYIARYEASNDGDDNAQSKPNQTPWVNIPWGTDMTDVTGGAVEKARSMYKLTNETEEKDAVSTLIYGTQWDATVRWLKSSYPEIEKDSTKYGNYKNAEFYYTALGETTATTPKEKDKSVKIPTGSTEYTKTNNIYDLAGNVFEWTMEAYLSDFRIYRGGYYDLAGSRFPVSRRLDINPDGSDDFIGFRPVLYIK